MAAKAGLASMGSAQELGQRTRLQDIRRQLRAPYEAARKPAPPPDESQDYFTDYSTQPGGADSFTDPTAAAPPRSNAVRLQQMRAARQGLSARPSSLFSGY
jgi:hypothetical protein